MWYRIYLGGAVVSVLIGIITAVLISSQMLMQSLIALLITWIVITGIFSSPINFELPEFLHKTKNLAIWILMGLSIGLLIVAIPEVY